MVGFDSVGRFALGQLPTASASASQQLTVASSWAVSARSSGLTAAVIATTFAGFVSPPQVQAAPLFSRFSEPLRKPLQQAEWRSNAIGSNTPAPVFSPFAQPLFTRAVLVDEQPGSLFEAQQPAVVPFSGFAAFSQPWPVRSVMPGEHPSALFEFAPASAPFSAFAVFSQPLGNRYVIPDEQPSALFEFFPVNIPFTGFCNFSITQFLRFTFADQQTSKLFEEAFAAPVQRGGTSRKLEQPEPLVETPRRKKKTGFEPIKKQTTHQIVEPRKQAPLPPFEPAPQIDGRSPLDMVDRDLIPHDLLGLQQQIQAAQNSYADQQDADDIADVLLILERLDKE